MSIRVDHLAKRTDTATAVLRRATAALALLSALTPLCSLAGPTRDDAIKAGFLFNFAEFAKWPDDRLRASDIRFCIEADTIPSETFGSFSGVQIGDRQISTSIFAVSEFLRRGRDCDLIFLRKAEMELSSLMSLAEKNHILLVSDRPDFAAAGGHIELYLSQERYRFRVNLAAMKRSGVELSSKVLRLAEIVSPEGGN